MAGPALNAANHGGHLEMPQSFHQPLWYAAYTSANHEKRVGEQLAVRSVEHFLPLYSSLRRWKDRRGKLELPLFPRDVFLCFALPGRLVVLQNPPVAGVGGVNGMPPPPPPGKNKEPQKSFPLCLPSEHTKNHP